MFLGVTGTTGGRGDVHSVSLVVFFFFFFFSSVLFSPFCKDGLHRKQTEKRGKNERKAAITIIVLMFLLACFARSCAAAEHCCKRSFKAQYSSIFMCVCVCVLLFCFDLLTLLFSVASFLCNLVFNPVVLPFQLCQL